MQPTKADVARQFGRMSRAYATSPGHASGSDLQTLVELLDVEPHMKALDVATGAGHTALGLAPHVESVIAVDLAPEMIEQVQILASERALKNIQARVMDCEALAFPDGTFDVVTCRIAPHHFLDVIAAVREMARVLRPGGRLGLEDSVSPPDPILDSFINQLEKLRDATHIRSYTDAEWITMLEAAGFKIQRSEPHRKDQDIAEWIERSGIDAEAIERVYAAFAAAPPQAREHFKIEYDGERAVRFTDDKVLLLAVNRR